jgi:hypothetical protein
MPKLIRTFKRIKPKPSAKYSVAAVALSSNTKTKFKSAEEECGILTYDPRKKTAKAKARAAAAAVKAKMNMASSFLFADEDEDEGGADYQDGLRRLSRLRSEMACPPSVGINPSLNSPHTDIMSGANNSGRMDMNQNNNIVANLQFPPSLSYHDAAASALLRGITHIDTSGLSPSLGVMNTQRTHERNNPRIINQQNNRRGNEENGPQSSSSSSSSSNIPGGSRSTGGRTAGNRVRHFIQHSYRDLASEPTVGTGIPSLTSDSFPMILHKILDTENYIHIISWQPHGRAFIIRDWSLFQQFIMPKYFPNTIKVESIKRQFNLYGFERLSKKGPDKGSYYHEAFLRGRPDITSCFMVRKRVKGTGHKGCSNPDAEPNFYTLPFVMKGGKLFRSWQSHDPTSLSSLRSMLNK